MALVETVRTAGMDGVLSAALGPWRKATARHDPGKVLLDLAITLAVGGDCLADVALLRAEPGVFGPVASDPTVSRTIDALAADADRVLSAIDGARAAARARVWTRPATVHPTTAPPPRHRWWSICATLVTAHSDKQDAAPTFKRGFGFHPMCAFVDHGQPGTGEPLAIRLRPGNAGSNTASDHVAVTRAALRQLPTHRPGRRPGRRVLVRTDAAGCTHAFLDWLVGQRLGYSVGFTLPDTFADTVRLIPKQAWSVALDADGRPRDGAWVAEATGLLDLSPWPSGTRVIVRAERPHPGAQLRLTDADGHRLTAFATNTSTGQLSVLELRHRRRARAEDPIRCAKDTGLANLPLHDFDQNRIWCAVVALAGDLLAWMQLLALADHLDHPDARQWEPKRLRLRLFSAAGRLATSARRTVLHLSTASRWTGLLLDAIARLRALAVPG